jgi:hypothetical protein
MSQKKGKGKRTSSNNEKSVDKPNKKQRKEEKKESAHIDVEMTSENNDTTSSPSITSSNSPDTYIPSWNNLSMPPHLHHLMENVTRYLHKWTKNQTAEMMRIWQFTSVNEKVASMNKSELITQCLKEMDERIEQYRTNSNYFIPDYYRNLLFPNGTFFYFFYFFFPLDFFQLSIFSHIMGYPMRYFIMVYIPSFSVSHDIQVYIFFYAVSTVAASAPVAASVNEETESKQSKPSPKKKSATVTGKKTLSKSTNQKDEVNEEEEVLEDSEETSDDTDDENPSKIDETQKNGKSENIGSKYHNTRTRKVAGEYIKEGKLRAKAVYNYRVYLHVHIMGYPMINDIP